MTRVQVGADIGGTFTDVVVQNLDNHRLAVSKAFSTPDDPIQAVREATRRALQSIDGEWSDIVAVRHGTTIAANAVLERRGAKTALVVTKGFRDTLFVGRQTRPSLYNLRARYPLPVVPRHLTYEIDERTAWSGHIERSVERADVATLAEHLRAEQIESVAVSLLHSYANEKNELEIRRLLREFLPQMLVCLSSEICPQIGEYERATTTALNAYVSPPITRYLVGLGRELEHLERNRHIYTMQSNGGAMSTQAAKTRSVHTLLSGPAGGLIGAQRFADRARVQNAITLDVGGTSADVGLIVNGVAQHASKARIAGMPVLIPFLDIHTVGAGGGSIAWIDPAGALRVGPQSAGSQPGPMCYSRGGNRPTVTDAHVALGNIGPGTKLGGRKKLDVDAAVAGIKEHVAQPLELSLLEAAEGIIEVANVTMARAIHVLTVERGLDPKSFALIAFGGAGPLHAPALARALGVKIVIIPPYAGVLSAVGMLAADVRHDFVQTHIALAQELAAEAVTSIFDRLERKALRVMEGEGFSREHVILEHWVEMRYAGQGHQLPVRLLDDDVFSDPAAILQRLLHEAHDQRYGYAFEEETVEVVQFGLTASAVIRPFTLPRMVNSANQDVATPVGRRPVWLEQEWRSVKVFGRSTLVSEDEISGPAIIESDDTTIVVPPDSIARMDASNMLKLDLA